MGKRPPKAPNRQYAKAAKRHLRTRLKPQTVVDEPTPTPIAESEPETTEPQKAEPDPNEALNQVLTELAKAPNPKIGNAIHQHYQDFIAPSQKALEDLEEALSDLSYAHLKEAIHLLQEVQTLANAHSSLQLTTQSCISQRRFLKKQYEVATDLAQALLTLKAQPDNKKSYLAFHNAARHFKHYHYYLPNRFELPLAERLQLAPHWPITWGQQLSLTLQWRKKATLNKLTHQSQRLSKILTTYQNQAQALESKINLVEYGPDLLAAIIGDFKQGLGHNTTLPYLALELFERFPLSQIVLYLAKNYGTLTSRQRLRCLKLVYQLINTDTHYTYFNLEQTPTEISQALKPLLQLATLPEEQPAVEQLQQLLQKLQTKKNEAYQKFIEAITTHQYPTLQLLKTLGQLNLAFTQQHISSFAYVVQLADFFQHAHSSYYQSHHKKTLIMLYKENLHALPALVQNMLHSMLEAKLQTIDINTLPIDTACPLVNQATCEPYETWLKQVKHLAQGTANLEQIQSMLQGLVKQIVIEYLRLINAIPVEQLCNAAWLQDFSYETQQKYCHAQAPSVLSLHHFSQLITLLVKETLLYKVESAASPATPRHELAAINRLYVFYQHLIVQLIQAKDQVIVKSFQTALNSPEISRLNLAQNKATQNYKLWLASKVKPLNLSQLATANLFSNLLENIEQNAKQPLSLRKIRKEIYYLDRFAKFKTNLKHQVTLTQSSFMASLSHNLLRPSVSRTMTCGEGKWLLDDKAKRLYLTQSKALLEPIVDFLDHDLITIANQLKQGATQQRSLKFVNDLKNINYPQSYQLLMKLVINKLSSSSNISPIKEVFLIPFYLDKISAHQDNTYKNLYQDWLTIFSLYLEQVNKLVNQSKEQSDWQLPQMLHNFLAFKKILIRLIRTHPRLKVSQKATLLGLIKKINSLKNNYIQQEKRQNNSPAYIKWLSAYLVGNHQNLPLPGQHESKQSAHSNQLIQDYDYDVETDPNFIGTATSLNVFETGIDYNASPPFSVDSLIRTFLNAFTWAIYPPQQPLVNPMVKNLLQIEPLPPTEVQKVVLDTVYLGLYTISQLAGPQGESALHHLNKIDEIISIFQWINQSLVSDLALTEHEFYPYLLEKLYAHQQTLQQWVNSPLDPEHCATQLADNHATKNKLINFLKLNERESHYHIQQQVIQQNLPEIINNGSLLPKPSPAQSMGKA
jgi:hypothetical protein